MSEILNSPGGLKCPHCEEALKVLALGAVNVAECWVCRGIWVERAEFKRICEEREHHGSVLGRAREHRVRRDEVVKYVKCPVCGDLMHRKDFAKASSVVIDVCALHGAWLDAEELERIVVFIRSGGAARLEELKARELEKAKARVNQDWMDGRKSRARSRTKTSWAESLDLPLDDVLVELVGEVVGGLFDGL